MRLPFRQAGLRKQHGIAMITAMMITAIAVTVIATIFVQQRYSIRLTSNFQDLEQAYQYAYAAEDLASVWLKRDLEENQHDSSFDGWAFAERPPFEIDDDDGHQIGEMISVVEDMQGYLNLNNLLVKPRENRAQTSSNTNQSAVNPAEDPEYNKPHEAMMQAFTRLFQTVGVPPEFRLSILDWIDPNDAVADPGSAESDYYLTLDPPYRAANALLNDPAELAAVHMTGVDDPEKKAEILANLLPHVVALPTPTALNVNTATELSLTAVGLTSDQVNMVKSIRESGPITDIGILKQNVPGISNEALAVLGVESNYFRLSGQVKLGKSRLFLNSLLFRSPEGDVRVIMRQFSRIPKPKTANPAESG